MNQAYRQGCYINSVTTSDRNIKISTEEFLPVPTYSLPMNIRQKVSYFTGSFSSSITDEAHILLILKPFVNMACVMQITCCKRVQMKLETILK